VYDEEFTWYPYLFLNRSKPETHLDALSRVSDEDMAKNLPPELKALIDYVKVALGLKRLE
jgi:putative ATP-dependent endonuclease of OLD family